MKQKFIFNMLKLFLIVFMFLIVPTVIFGDNLALDNIVSCSSGISQGACIYAHDGINYTPQAEWTSNTASWNMGSPKVNDKEIIVDAGSVTSIGKVNVTSFICYQAGIRGGDFTVYYSDDNSSWTRFGDIEVLTGTDCIGEHVSAEWTLDVDARFVMVNFTNIGEWVSIVEVLVFEGDTVIPTVYLNISNKTTSDMGVSLKANQPFLFNANYSIGDSPDTESSCVWNASDISANFFFNYGNYTISNSTPLTSFISEGTSDLLYDVMNGRVCRENTGRTLNVYANGTLIYNVSGFEIPKCSVGFHENTINFTSQNTNSYVNVTLICPDCTPSNGIKLIADSRNNTFYYQRVFSKHSETMTYNSTNKKYVYYNYFYSLRDSGINIIDVSCNNSLYNNTLSLSVAGQNIEAKLLELTHGLTSVAFTNNVSIQERESVFITGDCQNDLTELELINVSYLNGSIISSMNTDFLNLSVTSLPTNTTYNVSLYCKSVQGVTNKTSKLFYLQEIPQKVSILSPFDSQINTSNPLKVFFNFTFQPTYCGLWGNSSGSYNLVEGALSGGFYRFIKTTIDSTKFNNGTYINTSLSANKIISYNNSNYGVYFSEVYDFGSSTKVYNFSYYVDMPFNNPLPDNHITESTGDFKRFLDMSNNVLLLHFNESLGTNASDSSGNNKHGTLVNFGNDNWTTGYWGNGLEFDGADDYVNLSQNFNFEYTNSFSIGAWMKIGAGLYDVDQIVSKMVGTPTFAGWVFAHSEALGMFLQLGNQSGSRIKVYSGDGKTYNDSLWHFVVVSYNGNGLASGIKMVVDGEELSLSVIEDSLGGKSIQTSADTIISCRVSDMVNCIDGVLDEVFIFDDALTVQEMKDIYLRTSKNKINISVRSCDDDSCSGESFVKYEQYSPISLSLGVNRWFQFLLEYTNPRINYGVELFNVSYFINETVNGLDYSIGGIYNFSQTFGFNTEKTLSYYMSCNVSSTVLVNSTKVSVYYNNTDADRPFVNVTLIDNTLFSPNITIESTNITFNGSCTGDIVNLIWFNVSYSNGTLAYQTILDDEYFNLSISSLYFRANDNYTVSVACQDFDNQWSSMLRNFQLLDTVYPRIIWNIPNADNTTEVQYNNTLNIDVNVFDYNLFSVRVRCYDNLSVLIQDFYIENLSVQSYQFRNNTDVLTNLGYGYCNTTGQDWHTLNDISKEDLKPSKEDSSISFKKDKKKFIINYTNLDVDDFVVEKEIDKYTFQPIPKDKKQIPSVLSNTVKCDGDILYYTLDLEYGHTFSCGKLWYDAYIDGVDDDDDYKIIMLPDNTARVEIKTPKDNDDGNFLKTKSVGVKNEHSDIVEFEVTAVTSNIFEELTLAQTLIYGLFVIIWLAILIIGLFFGIPAMVLVSGLIGFFIGIAFIPMSGIIAFIIIMLNVMIFIMAFIGGKG